MDGSRRAFALRGYSKRLKMIVSCLQCGSEFKTKPFAIKRGRGKYCSRNCYGIVRSEWMKDKQFNPVYRVDFKKDKNPNWRGGTAYGLYSFDFKTELSELVRKRDGYKCQECGAHQMEFSRKLSVHHKDHNKRNDNPDNLITICPRCHIRHHEPWKGGGHANVPEKSLFT
jgi:hypothetical protein